MSSTMITVVPESGRSMAWLELLCGALGLLLGLGVALSVGPSLLSLPLAGGLGIGGVCLGESVGRSLGRLLARARL